MNQKRYANVQLNRPTENVHVIIFVINMTSTA